MGIIGSMFITGIQKDKGEESSSLRGFNTEIAMRKAKENVEKHYAVVGVLEELNKTLTVLEHYVPRFFKGAKDVYWNEVQIFSRELEFFDFCKQRLHKQYLALNLDTAKP